MLALISLRFSVNRRIFVVGFGLYGSIHGPTDYQVNIQVRILINNNILTALKDETAGLLKMGEYVTSNCELSPM